MKTFRAHKHLRRNSKLALFTKEVLLAVQSSYKRYTSEGKCLLKRLKQKKRAFFAAYGGTCGGTSARDRRPPPSTLLYPIGARRVVGFGAMIPSGGAPFSAVGGPAKWRGLPDCFRANHQRLSGSPGAPMKLRAGSQGTGELSRKWGGSEALPTPPGLCAWAGFPVPSLERNAALFFPAPIPKIPAFIRGIPGMPSKHRKQLRAGAAARSDVEMLHAEVRVERVAEPQAPSHLPPRA